MKPLHVLKGSQTSRRHGEARKSNEAKQPIATMKAKLLKVSHITFSIKVFL
jgi:hypothetical protein